MPCCNSIERNLVHVWTKYNLPTQQFSDSLTGSSTPVGVGTIRQWVCPASVSALAISNKAMWPSQKVVPPCDMAWKVIPAIVFTALIHNSFLICLPVAQRWARNWMPSEATHLFHGSPNAMSAPGPEACLLLPDSFDAIEIIPICPALTTLSSPS